MTSYLSAGTIAESVKALQQSAAQSRLCEFLIGLRTLTLAGKGEVQVAESVSEFVKALNELTACKPSGIDSHFDGEPFINPFGTARGKDEGRAYKSAKFPSNGPSNTMHGWATQQDSPFEIVTTTRPKGIRRKTATHEQLQRFLLLRGAVADERPRLLDAAIWFYRATDVEARFGGNPTGEELESAFVEDIGLTNADVDALFTRSTEAVAVAS